MGKKTKTGKGRLDKFYHLAKEQGFRARSAFKLTQLAKQYNLFARTNVCVDLCGAPGGWSQVAVQAMGRGSKVICVDLVPIKPIKGVVTIQSDITTQTCRNLIKQELNNKSHVCDIVLNDGAPNVGAAWSKDAYNQAELTLHAFQLACDLLRPGGTFVTKVFRSADYNSLLWAFQQLFSKVESTKPSASRAVSAEIFVVCQGFKAPPKIDPKFFSPKFVFMNEEGDNDEEDDEDTGLVKKISSSMSAGEKPSSLSGLLKAMAKRNRSGYVEGDDFRTVTVDEFLASKNPAELLIRCHKIIVQSDAVDIPESIAESFGDLKVLGKGELYSIMKWRTKVLNGVKKDHLSSKSKNISSEQDEEVDDPVEEENVGEDGDKELSSLLKSRIAEEKREAKRQRVKDKKSLMRKKMSLDNGVVGIAETTSASFEPDLFHIPKAKAQFILEGLNSAPTAANDDEEDEDEIFRAKLPKYTIVERGSESLIEQYEEEFAEEHKVRKETGKQAPGTASAADGSIGKRVTRRQKHVAQWAADVDALGEDIEKKAYAHHSSQLPQDAPSSDDEDEEHVAGKDYYSDDDLGEEQSSGPTALVKKNLNNPLAARWFSNPIFSSSGGLDDDEEVDGIVNELGEKDLPIIPMSEKQEKKQKRKNKSSAAVVDGADEEIEVVPVTPLVAAPTSLDEIAQVQALGSLLVHKKSRREVIESGFNRYARDETEDLPDWFREEEDKFTRKQLPLTKELMAQYRSKLREINARPIRKEAEAQGRRKRRMERKLSTLKQQAASLAGEDGEEHGSLHKAKQIAKAMKATKRESKRKTVFMAVQRKGGASKQIGGEGGRGAKVAMIDRRLKKDRRGQKNAAMRKKGRR